jgi:hypothetical protein
MTDLYDALTIELERADVLTEHLAKQLSDLAETRDECYALSLITESINEKHAAIRVKAQALLSAAKAADAGGAR